MGVRVRRSADEAQRMILSAAEKRLRAGGPAAVRVQLVARDVGLTDAALHHHFGSRKGLLTALLRHAGRELRGEIETAVGRWERGSRDLSSLTDLIADCYERRGYARLAMWLMLSGARGKGSGMLSALVDALHRDRVIEAREQGAPPPNRAETLYIVALFHMVQVAEPLFGEGMRRSAGLPSDDESRDKFRAWLLGAFELLLRPNARSARRSEPSAVSSQLSANGLRQRR
jgi:TetR/AcrR family transcriptional regulator, repressor for neighboring sulfatase